MWHLVQGPQFQRDMHASGGGDVHFSWQARCAILSALATYLHASPSVQRAAVRKWEPVAALFGLLWDDSTRKIALSMVRHWNGPLYLATPMHAFDMKTTISQPSTC